MALRVTVIAGGVLDPGTAPASRHDLSFVPLDDTEALKKSLAEADAFVTRQVLVNDELLAVCKRLRLVQQVGAGINRIDLAAAGARGIPVANTPGAPTIAVAEHMVLLILAALRDLPGQIDAVRAGRWPTTDVWENDEICGRTIGLIGYGSIGRAFTKRMLAFDARMLVTTRTAPLEAPHGVRFVDLVTLLQESEILVIAAPLTSETKGMIGAAELAKMKPSALFVNVGRGAIVDEAALCEALAAGRIGGAALDVFTQEPLPLDSPFRKLPNVILTPHSGGSTKHARGRIWTAAMDNLDRLAEGRELINIVNRKELAAGR